MNEPSLEQALSALMDGEASELELMRVLKHAEDDQLRQTWQRYQTVRAAMHQEPVMSVDVLAAVREAVAGIEPGRAEAPAAPAPVRRGFWQAWSKVAVAASVTLAVLGGARFYTQMQEDIRQPALASAEQPAAPVEKAVPAPLVPAAAAPVVPARPVVLVSHSGQAPQQEQQEEGPMSRWHREQLPMYLRQHVQQAGMGGSEGALPYARSASMEGH